MPFPISISKTITFKQPEKKITSDKYILNHIYGNMKSLNMATTSASDNEFKLIKVDFIRGFRRKDFLRNISVKVHTNQSEIYVRLKSNTLVVFLFGFVPAVLMFVQDDPFPLVPSCVFAGFIWGIGLIPRWVVLLGVKADVEQHLKSLLNVHPTN